MPPDLEQFQNAIENQILSSRTRVNAELNFLGLTNNKLPPGAFQFDQHEFFRRTLQKFQKFIEKNYCTSLPFQLQQKLLDDNSPQVAAFNFRERLRKLLYLRFTRPDS